jgi:hypothetical protein
VLDTDTETRVSLMMSAATRDDLYLRAATAAAPDERAASLLRAIARQELAGTARAAEWRIRCDSFALAFIREETPEVARNWPAVFGDVPVPRSHILALIGAGAPGQTVAGVHLDGTGMVRLEFESGDALIVDGNGALDWRPA